MFTAREWDAESGLYYYRARMYHPQLGRFLSPDPVTMHLLRVWAAEGNKPKSSEGIYISGKMIQKFIQKDPVGRFLAGTGGTGRFLQEYTNIGTILTLNLYAYVGNNPLNYVDPHGLLLKGIFGGILIPIGLGLIGCPGWGIPGAILVGIGVGLIYWDYVDDPVTDSTVDECKNAFQNQADQVQQGYDDYGNRYPPPRDPPPPPQ